MLSTLAARPVSIDPQILSLDIDFNRLIDFRRNKHAGERGMPPLCLVEWRDSHQAVHANLTRKQPKSKFATDSKRNRLHARFFARLIVIHHRAEALPFCPA